MTSPQYWTISSHPGTWIKHLKDQQQTESEDQYIKEPRYSITIIKMQIIHCYLSLETVLICKIKALQRRRW